MKTRFENARRPLPARSVNELQHRIRKDDLPQIVMLTTFPPRQCGIATYSQDLVRAMEVQFHHSFLLRIAALENAYENEYAYDNPDVEYTLNTSQPSSYTRLASDINANERVRLVVIQHEFGLFSGNEASLIAFLEAVEKPICLVFHTVLPNPNERFRAHVQDLLDRVDSVVVMTHHAKGLLQRDYAVLRDYVSVIPHGTHLVGPGDKEVLKRKYGFEGRRVLSTFGLLGRGKSIETTLRALPDVVSQYPDTLFLIIGKTHPGVVNGEGEAYRDRLEAMTDELGIRPNVRFINQYVALDELLEYLQLTDVYLFTSKDPHQAVSGTFAYAMSCGCPIISTPIPHAVEVLDGNRDLMFDFDNSEQLAQAINRLLGDEEAMREAMLNGLHKITPTSWENSAIAHAKLFRKMTHGFGSKAAIELHYRNPEIRLDHLKRMTTDIGMYQFARLGAPNPDFGYTLDDNARAMIAMAQHYKLTRDADDFRYLATYLDFIEFCQQPDGSFLNYVDIEKRFTRQNADDNLSDSNGRAMWALGYLVSLADIIPQDIIVKAKIVFHKATSLFPDMHSPRAMAFSIKGLYYYNRGEQLAEHVEMAQLLADRLVRSYRLEAETEWKWFESYLTYANSVLPEALLCAYCMTGKAVYRDVALESFHFLLEQTFHDEGIKVVSNRSWMLKGKEKEEFGEQPIDVAYTILALRKFHDVFKDRLYLKKMEKAFNWFLGNNHLNQIIYNPQTGGCYDGLEETCVNLNQGAESTVSYLMARLTIHKHLSFEEDVSTVTIARISDGLPTRQKKANTIV